MKNWIQTNLALLYGKYFSLDRIFCKKKAVAVIYFIEGQTKKEGSIRIEANGITYFFEGKPIIEEYKNAEGKNVMKKSLKYGGWEVDMRHSANKIF